MGDDVNAEGSEGAEEVSNIVSFADKAREALRRSDRSERSGHSHPRPRKRGGNATADVATGALYRRLEHMSSVPAGPLILEDQLAHLVYDSETPASQSDGVRSSGRCSRQLTFESTEIALEVELDNDARELTCQVVPPQPASLELRHAGGSIALGQDPFGVFYAPAVPAGNISLRCVLLGSSGDHGVVSSWVGT